MFRSHKVARLQARLNRAIEQRDWARTERDTHRTVAVRIAAKFSEAHDLVWAENALLASQVDAWSSHAVDQAELFSRAMRARATESRRHRAVISHQGATILSQARELTALKERLAAQEDQLEILQAANEAHYRDLATRPARSRAQRARHLEAAS